jgi:hypothetical protein
MMFLDAALYTDLPAGAPVLVPRQALIGVEAGEI